jgi:hypothetical protein
MWKWKDLVEFGQGVVIGTVLGAMVLIALG